jgi:heme-degrading monooxygenase HmoA
MIVRIWRGTVRKGGAGDYREHLERRVFPALAGLAGHRGAFLLQREAADGTEVLAVTLWEALASIEAFAGAGIDRAVVEPEAQALMARFEETVLHYEVALTANLDRLLGPGSAG